MDKNAAATKKDIEDVLETISELTNMIAERFERMDERFDRMEARQEAFESTTEANFNRLENKLSPTIDQVDGHEVRIKRLEQATA